MSKPPLHERKALEREVDELTDKCIPPVIPWQPMPLPPVDPMPLAVQKCAEQKPGEDAAAMPPPPVHRQRRRKDVPAPMPPPPIPRQRKDKEAPAPLNRQQLDGPSGSADRARIVPPPPSTVAIQFACEITVPRTWTFGDALSRIRDHMRPELCIVDVDIGNPMKIQLKVPSLSSEVSIVAGAGRSVRVQHDTVARNALCFITSDLTTVHCDRFNQKFLRSVLARDRKCALATFTASTPEQRFRSMAAAFRRIGLEDQAADILSLIPQLHHGNPSDGAQAQPIPVVVIDDSSAVSSSSASAMQDAARAAGPVVAHDDRLCRRVDAIEAWAHALDSQLDSGNVEADNALSRTRELMSALAAQHVHEESQNYHVLLQLLQSRMEHLESHASERHLSARIDQLQASLEAAQVQLASVQESIDLKEHGLGDVDTSDFDRIQNWLTLAPLRPQLVSELRSSNSMCSRSQNLRTNCGKRFVALQQFPITER
eukprot:6464076-Amphidinium_carterae.1